MKQGFYPAQTALHGRNDSFIAGGFLPLCQRFEQDKQRPWVQRRIAGAGVRVFRRPQPAVFMLMGQNVIDPALRFCEQARVVQKHSQGDQAIQPVRPALPSFALPANPEAVGNRRPELIQMPGQSGGLNPKLVLHPPDWQHRSQRQRLENARFE